MKEKKMDLCRNMNQLKEFIDRIIQKGICALDTETTGLNTRVDANGKPYIKTVGISLAIDAIEGIYIPMNHTCDPELNLPEKEVWKEIDRLCKNSVTIFHNAKYDIAVLKNEGVIVDDFEKYEDTLLMAYLFDAGQKGIGLKDLSDKLLGQPMIDFDKITGGSGKFNIISPEIGYVYAASDAICTFGLYEYFLKQKTFLDQKAVYNLEKRIVFVVMQMEANLVNIDKEYLIEEKARIAIKLEDIKKEVITLAGEDFNVASTQQLGHILFDKLKYRYPEREKTKSGQYKTDTATLEKIEDEYPIVKKLIQFRTLEKILGTYIENLINNCDENNCVKLGFKQTGTETGRFSCPGGFGLLIDGYSAVNVQSIPANYDETIPDVRRAFRARKGFKIVAMDFSGEELRVAANLSKEKKWLDEFLYGEADLHTVSAMTVYKKEREDVTKLDRKTGKCVAKGTLIASECGWIPIENLKVGDRVITRSGELKEIDKIWNMGIKPGVLIETKSGQKITCGRNHRFLSINDEDWIKAEDMVVGTKIKTANCNKINPQESKKVNFNVWNKGNNNLISKNLPIIEISPLWARLMGYVLGDGSAYKESVNVVCSDEYEDVKEDIFETAKKLGLDPKITYN
jgi:DNA polymerase-1